MLGDTYTGRTMGEPSIVKRIGEGGSFQAEDGWGFGGHPSLTVLRPGDIVQLEHHGAFAIGRPIVGVRRHGGAWLYRKSDQQIEAEHQSFLDDMRRREEEQLAANRDDWTHREAALPEWLRERLAYFHARGGHDFEVGGWGYELTICEITVLLLEHDLDDDSEPVMAYARQHGTSGNQHSMALALARAHLEHPTASMGGTVSALSPITGDRDYSGRD